MVDLNNFPLAVSHSMEALPASSRIRSIYPEDIFPNGSYVQLPYGRVRFWLLGPDNGPRVVLIHGLSTPGITWLKVAPYLAERGFRVLVYDLYGKGYSEAPKTPYHVNLFITQLALLLQYIEWDHAHIAGLSMGGAITAAFTATLPHLVSGKVILIASGGVKDRPAQMPEPSAVDPIPQYTELRLLQTEHLPGYKTGVASCFIDGPIFGIRWAFDRLGDVHVASGKILQTLILHGTADSVVDFGQALEIKSHIPTAKLIAVEGAGHDLTLRHEHWEQVAEHMYEFLK
ncbi:alpha/beta-hydrolase [Sparassis latifolia]|uniref:Alpha/beta-hydrolase n=1 Tax=Sparassis crispa TaxID=139825 RepID=A0A401G7Z4_9APHY|nr:alpha/beta-hydrolase [Sparassis crispa]GBE78277.1 alpha/beta-hydrolase [Sparassis crispa]